MALTKVVNGKSVECSAEEEADIRARWNDESARVAADQAANGHKYLRKDRYPAMGDQLDAIWHAMDSGVLPMVKDFYEPIKLVKDTYPKGKQ